MGVGNDPIYTKTLCFDTFPFPVSIGKQEQPIRELAEQLDAHRKRQQEQHPRLTLTDMYNVLEKVRAGEPLDDKDRRIYEQGLIGILKEIHEELDGAVAAAYGWPPDLADEEILQRLVDLNAERAAEEANGLIRWLRPEYQAPEEYRQATQPTLIEHEEETAGPLTTAEKRPWPATLPEQARAVREALAALHGPAGVEDVAGVFDGRRTTKRMGETADLLRTLAALGQAEEVEGGRFVVI